MRAAGGAATAALLRRNQIAERTSDPSWSLTLMVSVSSFTSFFSSPSAIELGAAGSAAAEWQQRRGRAGGRAGGGGGGREREHI